MRAALLLVFCTLSAAAADLDRLRTMRIAPGPGAITREFVARQKAERFNTILLYDFDSFDGDWARPPAATVAARLELAREFGMSVVVWLPALIPRGDGSHVPVAPELLRERLRLWNDPQVIGIFFVPDDLALVRTPAALQREWLALAREVTTIPILSIVGEFALTTTTREWWDPAAFDHLLWINYPFNLGKLDHTAFADADAALVSYVRNYTAAMKAALFDTLAPGQLILPLIQTFTYPGEAPGSVPRARDIALTAHITHLELQTTLGQTDNFAMAWFYATASGTRPPYPEPLGIYEMPEWLEPVVRANEWLDLRARLAGRGRVRQRVAGSR